MLYISGLGCHSFRCFFPIKIGALNLKKTIKSIIKWRQIQNLNALVLRYS